MKHDDFLKDLHIGKIIKEIALQKGVSSKKVAAVIHHDKNNADKIFKMNDMNIEDVVRISYLLEYNILDFIAQKYLAHLPYASKPVNVESCLLKIDMRTQRVITYDSFNNCDFLKNIYIGQQIREIAQKSNLNEHDMAKRLQCSQGRVSMLYGSKSLKLKLLISISNALQYHFIVEVYLSQMVIPVSSDKFDGCIITLNPEQIQIINPKTNTALMIFQRNDTKN